MIRTEKVGFEYMRRDVDGEVVGITQALEDVSVNMEPGQFVAVLGANGSGKSTFAKHLSGLLVPGEGTVWVDGMDTREEDLQIPIRRTSGMVFQNPDNQMVASVVEEDVGFGPENIGVPSEEIWTRVEKSLKSVGMYEYRKASPNHLSGGQKQRVAIAGLLAMQPKCLVLDEPTAMLDPKGRKAVMDTAWELNRKENMTIVLITHYMEETVNADYIYVMNQGKVVLEGTPKQVFAQPKVLEQCKLQVPEITKIAAGLRDKGIPVPPDLLTEQELADWLVQWKASR